MTNTLTFPQVMYLRSLIKSEMMTEAYRPDPDVDNLRVATEIKAALQGMIDEAVGTDNNKYV